MGMIFQDIPFYKFTIWDAIESGLYYIIIGYYVLIFFYFILMRFRTSKKFYWFFFSLLFLFLAISRVCFIVYYFYIPELDNLALGGTDTEIVNLMMLFYRLATFFTWLAITSLMGVFGILIFPPLTGNEPKSGTEGLKNKAKKVIKNQNIRILLRVILMIIPLIVATLVLIMPDELLMDPDLLYEYPGHPLDPGDLIVIFGYPVGRFVLNLVLLPLMVLFIPIMFIYLAKKTFGVLRRSYALNALGFFIYFLGRILQGLLDTLGYPHYRAILPPLLILLSLLIIVIANNYEQLK